MRIGRTKKMKVIVVVATTIFLIFFSVKNYKTSGAQGVNFKFRRYYFFFLGIQVRKMANCRKLYNEKKIYIFTRVN